MACEISALEELHTELTCPICLDMFNEPVILECGHHFCRSCIRQCWEAKSEESTSCPKCRKRCTRSLRPNSLLCNVVQSVRRARAKDARPKERAPKMPPDNAKLSSVTASHAEPVSNLCTDHEEKLKLFCEDDQVAICLVCGLSRDHKTHNVIPINEAYDNYKETLSSLVQRVEEQMGTASQYQVLTNDMILQMKDQADVLEIQISSEFQKIRDFLSRQEQEMKMRLHQAKEKRLKVLGDTLTHTTSQLSQLELSKHLIQTKLSQVENPEILTDIKDFIESVQCVEAITFDPLTAYPRLWVSCCGRSVCVGKIQTGLPNNPERFTLYNIVLGSQAISEGRHYWEVQVGGKTAWGLGVASASVNRKEELSLCPEEGFWTLVLSENGYEACNSTVESPLELAHPPRRVGVYLDYGRGHVSFYDAEDMTHLYTFVNAHFTEPVYPYFNPWPIMNGRNREPLTIHMPQL
ncbi:nuclear factor 7, brain-like isoform X3 [Electrophorus electricus]|uniref:nuclear factor 7, brain-like isoform X3 n=1 Tax=Electrophorus electricus TaxID=8005 RepID=UPI000F0A2C82|nr:nuclear factor 7, brain-like isoform X3 [Electrophorus electricus]